MEPLNSTLARKLIITFSSVFAVLILTVGFIFQTRQSALIDADLKERATQLASAMLTLWQYNAETFVNSPITLSDSTRSMLTMVHYNPRMAQKDAQPRELELLSARLPENYYIRQTTLNFRNPLNKPDENEEKLLKTLDARLADARSRSLDEAGVMSALTIWEETTINNQDFYKLTQPIIIKRQCLTCHGDRASAPEYVQNKYETGYGYRIGDLRGAVSVIIPAEKIKRSQLFNLLSGIGIILGAAALAIGMVVFMVQRALATPIQKIAGSAKRISEGYLAERVSYTQPDELGDIVNSFNMLVDSVKDSVREIMDLISRLNQVALDISNTAISISKSAESQSTAVKEATQTIGKMSTSINAVTEDVQGLTINVRETRTSIEDLISTVQESARNIQDANQVFSQVINEVQGGRFGIEQISQAILSISEKLEGLIQQIQLLERSTREITSTTDQAARTAKQTNLLAVNASIESAIAGEAGKGFRVVAGEIRSLAEQSSQSSQQIQEMVLSIRQNVMKIVDTVIETNQAALDSAALVKDAQKTLDKITQYYSRSSGIMSRLSGLIDAQMRSSQQVTMKTTDMTIRTTQIIEQSEMQRATGQKVLRTIETLSESALKNKTASQEISQLSQELINQAEQLQNSIRHFKFAESSQVLR